MYEFTKLWLTDETNIHYAIRCIIVVSAAETQLSFDNGSWCRMSGVVTEVGVIPNPKLWLKTTMYLGCIEKGCLQECHPEVFVSVNKERPSLQAMMMDVLVREGCLNGQRVISYAILNFDFFGDREYFLPVRKNRVYRIEYEVQDMMYHVWVVKKVVDVTNEVHPQTFREWKVYWEQPMPMFQKQILAKAPEQIYGSWSSRIEHMGMTQITMWQRGESMKKWSVSETWGDFTWCQTAPDPWAIACLHYYWDFSSGTCPELKKNNVENNKYQ